jgi:hypothetical protein
MSPPVDDAIFAIATHAGDDLVLLAPPDERHFDPFSATVAFAAVLMVRYLRGLTNSLEKGAEEAGEWTGEQIKKSLASLFGGRPDTTKKDAGEAVDNAAVAIRRSPDAVSAARDAARMRLIDALVANGLPADRALALVSEVQKHSDELIRVNMA